MSMENPVANNDSQENNDDNKPREYMEVNGVVIDATDMSPEERRQAREEANN